MTAKSTSEVLWVRSHVRQLLQEEWGVCRVEVDADGDVPFPHGCAACWVSVLESDPVMVRVFAYAARGVKPSAKLLRWLGTTQSNLLSARIDHLHGNVIVSQTFSPVGLTDHVLAQALMEVCTVADDIGPIVAAMFDGVTPYPADVEVDEDAP